MTAPIRTTHYDQQLNRRSIIIGAAASLICAPAIVRAASLMPIRGVVFSPEMCHFGFVERLYVHLHLPEITLLQNAGLSAHDIAADMNARNKTGFIFGDAWDGEQVIGLLKRHQLIQRTDLTRRRNYGQNLET
jgi:hypothetical protein